MKVRIAINHLEQAIPEFIPAIRQLGLSKEIPETIEIEAVPTESELKEREHRAKFPKYWENLTMTEWRLFSHLHAVKDASRYELKSLLAVSYNVSGMSDFSGTYSLSNSVDVHIKNLRKKLYLLGNEFVIVTQRAWGYSFMEGGAARASSQFDEFGKMKPARKRLNPDGSLYIPPWRHETGKLNSVEFGYLQEMKMDEIPKETAMERLALYGEAFDRAWTSKNLEEYLRYFIRRATSEKSKANKGLGINRCTKCFKKGHTRRNCPNSELTLEDRERAAADSLAPIYARG